MKYLWVGFLSFEVSEFILLQARISTRSLCSYFPLVSLPLSSINFRPLWTFLSPSWTLLAECLSLRGLTTIIYRTDFGKGLLKSIFNQTYQWLVCRYDSKYSWFFKCIVADTVCEQHTCEIEKTRILSNISWYHFCNDDQHICWKQITSMHKKSEKHSKQDIVSAVTFLSYLWYSRHCGCNHKKFNFRKNKNFWQSCVANIKRQIEPWSEHLQK